ncbi:ArnT family glycosyltransferase [Asticcacaulis sp.]|uniref:ArnT family glycosyltransferase n=1 Tax=Asticcacaulis sp. TaxID=1872648 RepID=UPI002CEAAFE3|nr:glycosyltransferase family 39 protein [Asticcacaulis sp.]HTM81792.1 glycosyltransferase family 39 protein [Asticcacaulis sp.]
MTLIARLRTIPYLPLLAGLMILRLIAAGCAGLVPDETYYWLWAQHPAFGYYDHPPMVAWWIAAIPGLPDISALFLRLPFVLSFAGLSWLIYDTGKTLFSETVARRALLWLNACLLLSVGSVIATPDPPSVLMWACGLWALAKVQATGKGQWWLVFGLFAGLGFEAKYTNLFLGLGVLAWFVLDKPARKWLLTPWPWLGGAVALAAMAPNLIWNAQHGWITFAKQFGRIEGAHFTAKYLLEFLISQPLLLNPLIFIFVVLGVFAWRRTRNNSSLALLIALPLPLMAYMLAHVFHDRIQGNWPAPVYPGLILLAAVGAEGGKFGWARKWAAPLGIGLSALVLLVMTLGSALPQKSGTAGLGQGWEKLAHDIQAKQTETGASWIATTDYNTQGELSLHIPTATVIGMAERERYAWPQPAPNDRALIVLSAKYVPTLDTCFTDLSEVGTVSRLKKSGKKTDFRLFTGRLKSATCEVPIIGS